MYWVYRVGNLGGLLIIHCSIGCLQSIQFDKMGYSLPASRQAKTAHSARVRMSWDLLDREKKGLGQRGKRDPEKSGDLAKMRGNAPVGQQVANGCRDEEQQGQN